MLFLSVSLITLLFLSILATGLSLHQFYLNGNSISKVATAKNIRISRLAVTANDLAVTSKSIDKDGTTDTRSDRLIRKLGGYERLLARKAPNSDRLSLSHTTVFFVDGVISDELLQYGIARCLRRHPMLYVTVGMDSIYGKIWQRPIADPLTFSKDIVNTKKVKQVEFEKSWKSLFEDGLNNADFPETSPQWRLTNIVSEDSQQSAWVITANHALDDQSSMVFVAQDLIEFSNAYCEYISKCNSSVSTFSSQLPTVQSLLFPEAIEDVIAPGIPGIRTVLWAIYQVFNIIAQPVMTPYRLRSEQEMEKNKYNDCINPDKRSTICRYFKLSPTETKRIVTISKGKDVTITNLLSSAMLCLSEIIIKGISDESNDSGINLRFLLSVGLRPFANVVSTKQIIDKFQKNSARNVTDLSLDYTGGTVACAAGAVDFIVPMSGKAMLEYSKWKDFESKRTSDKNFENKFWLIAKRCKSWTEQLIKDWQFVPESVRLFGLGMKYVDILKAVELDANSPVSMGRGFTCGVSNFGLVRPTVNRKEGDDTNSKQISITGGYYAVSHGRSGCMTLLSVMTIDGSLHGCLQFASPIITNEEADYFTENMVFMLKNIQ